MAGRDQQRCPTLLARVCRRGPAAVLALLVLYALAAVEVATAASTPTLAAVTSTMQRSAYLASTASPAQDPSSCPDMPVTVVYAAFLWPETDKWRFLVRAQLEQLVSTGLPQCAPIHVAMSTPAAFPGFTYSQLEDLLEEGRRLVTSIIPPRQPGQWSGSVVSLVHENSYEYPGIRLVWLLANALPPAVASNHAYLYFHTKGAVFHGAQPERLPTEVKLFNRTIDLWQRIVGVMERQPNITRVGLYPNFDGSVPDENAPPPTTDSGGHGFIWYNYWWARGSYLQTVEEPARNLQRRHYYEGWLGRSPTASGCMTCFRIPRDW